MFGLCCGRATLSLETKNMRLFFLALAFSLACNSKDGDDESDDWANEGSSSGGDTSSDDPAEDADDDEGEDAEPTGMETGRFLGTLAADWSADVEPTDDIERITVDSSCGGAVSLTLDEAMAITGTAGCSEDGTSVPVLGFDLVGTQTDLSVAGTMEMEFYGEWIEIAFTGTREGDELTIAFEESHEGDGITFDINGTLTANLVE